MTRTERGQAEPLVALAALAVLCLGISLYAVVLDGVTDPVDRDLAGPTLSRVTDRVVTAGVAHPAAVTDSTTAGPVGHAVNVSLTAAEERWTAGPAPPARADTGSRSVGVRLAPGRVRPGELRVTVWEGA